jgi:quercetin dioxygenase-like cupin family protein
MGYRRLLASLAIVASILGMAAGLQSVAVSAQEDDDSAEILFSVTLEEGQYPIAPAFVRLLRITMEEGASSPLHTHPGPEFGLVEAGTLTVQVNGAAELSGQPADGTPVAPQVAPSESEFELGAGDLITYLPQTAMTFRNAAADPVSILAGVLLPAGSQHPPGVTYIDGQPSADAFEGVAPEILGDGVATQLPRGGMTVTVERLRIGPGEPIPAVTEPVLLSLESGILDFTVVGGKVQISRTATPGPQPDTAPETDISLARGDAVFFPLGMKEVDRGALEGEVVLLRMTLNAAGDGPAPTPAESGVGEIRILLTEIQETPGASPSPDGTPTAEATPEDEGEPVFEEGALVESTAEGVNVRSGAGTSFEIVTQVFTGEQMRITGDSEEAEGFVWWPVELVADPSVTGYIAEDFIALVEE